MIILLIILFFICLLYTIIQASIFSNVHNVQFILYEPLIISFLYIIIVTISSFIFYYFIQNLLYNYFLLIGCFVVYMCIVNIIYTQKIKKQKLWVKK